MKYDIEKLCRLGTQCGICRNREGGHRWRGGLLDIGMVAIVDFDCPHGHDWGYVPDGIPPKPKPRDPAICDDCPNLIELDYGNPACKLIRDGNGNAVPCKYASFLRAEIPIPEGCKHLEISNGS